MKKQIEAQDGNNLVLINIETKDYFSITADYLEPLDKFLEELEMTREEAEEEYRLIDLVEHKDKEYIMTGGGCMYDLILKLRPDLKPLVNLHLSNVETGEPMHAYANGSYHFTTDRQTGLKYIRATEEQLKEVESRTKHKDQVFNGLFNVMLPIWEEQAREGVKMIEKL